MLAVAEHYYHFGGRSPINDQCRALMAALKAAGVGLPIYWGNRNWHPMLADTVRQMRDDGVRSAIALATSAFGSYSGCRQYREDIEAARALVEGAPVIEKIPPFWSHPGFIDTMIDRVREALSRLPGAEVVYTAHSIPVSMAQSSPYEDQLREASGRVNRALGLGEAIAGFPEPERTTVAAVARAGYRRLYPDDRREAPGGRADRLSFRSHGSDLRPRHRSRCDRQRTRHRVCARRNGRNASVIHRRAR